MIKSCYRMFSRKRIIINDLKISFGKFGMITLKQT